MAKLLSVEATRMARNLQERFDEISDVLLDTHPEIVDVAWAIEFDVWAILVEIAQQDTHFRDAIRDKFDNPTWARRGDETPPDLHNRKDE